MKEKIVKVGEKGKNLELPVGWKVLSPDEVVKIGDKVANIRDVYWEDVEIEDIGIKAAHVGDYCIREMETINMRISGGNNEERKAVILAIENFLSSSTTIFHDVKAGGNAIKELQDKMLDLIGGIKINISHE